MLIYGMESDNLFCYMVDLDWVVNTSAVKVNDKTVEVQNLAQVEMKDYRMNEQYESIWKHADFKGVVSL